MPPLQGPCVPLWSIRRDAHFNSISNAREVKKLQRQLGNGHSARLAKWQATQARLAVWTPADAYGQELAATLENLRQQITTEVSAKVEDIRAQEAAIWQD